MRLLKKIKKGNKITYKFLGIKLSFLDTKAAVAEENRRLNYFNSGKLTAADKKRVIQTVFYNKLGYYPDVDDPKTFNEKIQFLKLYYDDPLISICCDKYKAKEYVAGKIGKEYVVKLLGVYDDADEIDFGALPDRFVLKVNDNSGYNIVVRDKSKINISEIRCKLNNWVQPWQNCYYEGFHIGYKNVEPKIIAEEYLDIQNNSKEYKIFCFNGKASFALIELDYFGKNPKRAFYDRNFAETDFKIGKMPKVQLPAKPENFDKMIALADTLCKPFPFVRVDFYDINGRLYIGEMTFYSGGGFSHIYPAEYDRKIGELLNLDNLNQKYLLNNTRENENV